VTDLLPERPPLLLDLRDVRKVYATGAVEVAALRGIDLQVETGEYVAIMGPSGSGKSTLMHIIGCLDVPSSGSFQLAGVDVSRMGERELAIVRNQRIGFVFQSFNLLSSMSAWRNVELPLVYAGVPRQERRRRAIEALTRVGLADRVDHRPGELSGGQQQRVSVARALVTEPDLLLADEPTGNLDSTATSEVLDLFDELRAQGRTIALITHEHDVALRAGRMVVIRDGMIASPEPVLAGGMPAPTAVSAATGSAATAPLPNSAVSAATVSATPSGAGGDDEDRWARPLHETGGGRS
jgi:putative ABC transport system ATP-binding protein